MAPTTDDRDVKQPAAGLHVASKDVELPKDADVIVPDSPDCLKDGEDTAFSISNFIKFAGPGIIMMTAFFDPGDLEADLQAGATLQFTVLWVYLWSTVMGYIMQMIAAKLGVASGKDLAVLCRENYPRPVTWALWLIMEAALVGVEIQYVVGAAVGFSLLVGGGLPLWASVIICGVLAYCTLMLEMLNFRWVEALFYGMITVMVISFVVLAGVAETPGADVIRGLVVPKLPDGAALVAAGIVGGAMSPYNFFFFSSLVLKRGLPMATRGEKRIALKYYSIEAAFCLFLALLMNVCVVCTFASAFYGTDLADSAGFLNAGAMLGTYFGNAYLYIWALGLFATGLSSTTASVYAGQAIMAGFIDIKLPAWQRAIITRTLAFGPALAVAACQKQDQDELDNTNLWLNLLQTIALPFALLPLLHFTCNKKVMGRYWVNNIVLALAAAAICIFGIFMAVYGTVESTPLPSVGWAIALASIGLAVYGAAMVYLGIGPDRVQGWFVSARRPALPCA